MGQFCLGLGRGRIVSDYHAEAVPLEPGQSRGTRAMQAAIEKSFALDPGWNAALHMIDAQVKSSIAAAFDSESANWLALQHGGRIVGGTLLMTDPDAPAQLVPGPCILMEYRNRGLGTLLLCSALRHLRDAGMIRAYAKTRKNSPAARFLYPKFGGQSSLIEPLLAA
jgi:GNAT superfamily N-acetyltransferase